MFILDPVIAVSIALLLAILFIASAAHKLKELERFVATLDAYELLPRRAVAVFARLLPLAEGTIGAALLAPVTWPVSGTAAASLLLLYAGAIGINLRRGRISIDCGCLGFGRAQTIAPWMVWRNCALSVLALLLLLPRATREWSITDVVTILGVVVAAAAQYLTLHYLLLPDGRRPDTAEG